MRIYSFSPFGYEGSIVSVEVDLRRGIPAIDVVGLADGAVREARERMRAAICNSGLEFPQERVLISLSPADLRKEGAGFDLPIALAVLDAKRRLSGMLSVDMEVTNGCTSESGVSNPDVGESLINEKAVLVMGELELTGGIRAVRGVYAALGTAAECGIKCCIVPKENMMEAMGLSNMTVYAAETLLEAYHILEHLNGNKLKQEKTQIDNCELREVVKSRNNNLRVNFCDITPGFEYADIRGQPFLVRGLQIAAAGGHNVFVYGPPGCGKTMAIQKFPALLPFLTDNEAQPVTRIYSIAGLMPSGKQLLHVPPFRMPHQSASIEGMAGGGVQCTPGEMSLAHNGVLFLDEAGEFRTSVLQCLRVPLESGRITLSRAGRHTVYPAEFQLLAAANPCPCGNFGSNEKICLCSARSVEQYWKKFSAPLLDRIDIRIPLYNMSVKSVAIVGKVETAKKVAIVGKVETAGRREVCSTNDDIIKNETSSISTTELRVEIGRAVSVQRIFQGKRNAHLKAEEIPLFCELTKECTMFLAEEAEKNCLSPRGVHSCIKLARTIADMKIQEKIGERNKIDIDSIKEAILYRKNEGGINIAF